MRVVIAHNAYQLSGGEDAVVTAETDLLRSHGHDVIEYRRHNDEITGSSLIRLAGGTVWSKRTYRELTTLLARERPQVVHSHNTFPLVSPSLYWAAANAGVAVVQT